MSSPVSPVRFSQTEDLFYKQLRRQVHAYFARTGKTPYATPAFYLKGGLMVAVYLAAWMALLAWGATPGVLFFCYPLMGATAILIGLSFGHDAVHQAISPRKWVNTLFLRAFDLLGANAFMWKNRHVYAHHVYPNILDQDSDIQQSRLVRVFPNDRIGWHNRFQHLYVPFLYLFYTLHWTLRRDFRDFFAEQIGAFRGGRYPVTEWIKLLIFKGFFIGYTLLLPLYLLPVPGWMVGLGWLCMNFAGSYVVAIALVSAHVSEDAVFPRPDAEGRLPHSWAEHQVITTKDFATGNPVINALFGGFNHHVIHHLFPHICHIHYPALTEILRQTAAEMQVPYQCEHRVGRAIVSHWKLLRNRGARDWLTLHPAEL